MNRAIVALAVALTSGPAVASDKDDIMAVLTQWISGEAGTLATCAEDAAIVDDIPPFEWHGPGACSRWQQDNDAYNKKEGITDATGTIGKPRQLMISGDRAYVVLPATFSVTQNGKRVTETATSTIVLQKAPAGWRISAWTWGTLTIH